MNDNGTKENDDNNDDNNDDDGNDDNYDNSNNNDNIANRWLLVRLGAPNKVISQSTWDRLNIDNFLSWWKLLS